MRYLVPAGLIYLAICAGLIIAMFLTAIDPPVCTLAGSLLLRTGTDCTRFRTQPSAP